MRVFIAILLLLKFVFAAEFLGEIKTDYPVTNLTLKDKNLYISTDSGEVLVYDVEQNQTIKTINLPQISSYCETKLPKVFSTDEFDDKILILSEDDYYKRAIYIYENGTLNKIKLDNESVKKALFINENLIVYASLSSEISFFDLNKKKIIFEYKFSTSSLGDIEIVDDILIVGCESGEIYKFSLNENIVLDTILAHKDNIYDLYMNCKDEFISGSADKNAVFYKDGNLKSFQANFLVYAVGLSDKYLAFMSDENSDILVLDKSFKRVDFIKTEQSTLNAIIIYKGLIFSSAYEKNIKIWRIK